MRKLRDEQKGGIFLGIIALIIIAVVLFFMYSLKTDRVREIVEDEKTIKMIMLVEDDDGDEVFSTLVFYDPETTKCASYNIPAYTGSIFESLGRTDSLAAVYKNKGIDVYKKEVEKMTGITIPFSIVIKMEDFVKITDMMGGMRVFISSPIDCISEEGERWLLPSGAVNLDGDKISVYLRYRTEDETDDDILDRYQNVVVAFLTNLHDNRYKIFDTNNYERYGSCISSNLSESDEKSLLKILSEVDAESVIRQTVTGSYRTVEGNRLLIPINNGDFLKISVEQTANMITASDGNAAGHVYVLQVLNGTSIDGLAGKTVKTYRDASYNVMPADNAPPTDETVIIDYIGNETAAKKIGQLIRCNNIRDATEEEVEENSRKASVDFTIILGRDFAGAR